MYIAKPLPFGLVKHFCTNTVGNVNNKAPSICCKFSVDLSLLPLAFCCQHFSVLAPLGHQQYAILSIQPCAEVFAAALQHCDQFSDTEQDAHQAWFVLASVLLPSCSWFYSSVLTILHLKLNPDLSLWPVHR